MPVPKTSEMRHVLKFELPYKSSDTTGGQNEQYVEWFTGRGSYTELSGTRKFYSGYDATVNVGEIYIPWRQEMDNNMSKDVRIVYDNRLLTIDHYSLVKENRRLMRITVKETK